LQQRKIHLQRRICERFKKNMYWILILVAFCASTPALAGEISGRASVIDGDTIEIHGQRIRIIGIDAPESRQICTEKATGAETRCGQKAAFWLSNFIAAHPVTCVEEGRDRYNRSLARCQVQESDVGAAMVTAGWALAFTRYSKDYVGQEAEAKSAGSGLWSTEFVAPWEWRRGAR